jgi:uncharacterized protein (DUF433 family)
VRGEPTGPDRFSVPLYTAEEAAGYLGVPRTTFVGWARGYRSGAATLQPPVVTAIPTVGHRRPVIPFVGLAEGLVLAAIRRAGVPLQRIRPALSQLQREIGLDHALASRRLYTDGAEVLFDYAEHDHGSDVARAVQDLVVVRQGQRLFNDVVTGYLRRVVFADDGYASLIRLPGYIAEVVVDPARGFGQPIFASGGARLEDALSMFDAGETLDAVSVEYGVPVPELEDALRVAVRRAA